MQIQRTLSGALAVLCAASIFSVPVLAGQSAKGSDKTTPTRPAAARRSRRALERLAKELKITPAQQAKIKPILAEEARQIKAIRAATRTKLMTVLTPEQRKKMAAIQARERQQQKARAVGAAPSRKVQP